jgi:UDP-2,4-diacetamido-2,4,6-trideoxy-beta-L-altropyranose hydrolase
VAGCRTKGLIEIKMSDIVLRPLKEADCDLLFSWRNDPWIISLSASQQAVEINEHQAWFAKALTRNDMLLRIICNPQGVEMGLVRVARENETEATITVYLMQPFIGEKRGPKAIGQACEFAFAQWPEVQSIHALIRRENTRSINAFLRIGFSQTPVSGEMTDDMVSLCLKRHS